MKKDNPNILIITKMIMMSLLKKLILRRKKSHSTVKTLKNMNIFDRACWGYRADEIFYFIKFDLRNRWFIDFFSIDQNHKNLGGCKNISCDRPLKVINFQHVHLFLLVIKTWHSFVYIKSKTNVSNCKMKKLWFDVNNSDNNSILNRQTQ